MSKETCWYLTYVDDSEDLLPSYSIVDMYCSECDMLIFWRSNDSEGNLGTAYCSSCKRYIQGVRLVDNYGQVVREYSLPLEEQK